MKAKTYNFDGIIDRKKTHAIKYDQCGKFFGTDDVLPLWIADMDFRTPDFIVESIRRRAAHEIYGYTYVPESFYTAVQGWLKQHHGWTVERDWILYCPGVVPSLVAALLALTDPGEAAAVQPPVYFPFFSVIRDNGRALINNPLILQNGRLSMDFDHLAKCLDPGVKLLFFCSPHNPGGTVWHREELEKLGDICKRNDTIIISDEIHSDLIFTGHQHIPTASVSQDLSDRTVTLLSPSKTFNISGLLTSVAIIPNLQFRQQFQETLQRLHWNTPNIFSIAAFEAAYRQGGDWLKQLMAYLESNLNYLIKFFNMEVPEIRVIPPEGSYLAWLDCRALRMTQAELRSWMIQEAKVALNDGYLFGSGGEGFQRINIACPRPILANALERIRDAMRSR